MNTKKKKELLNFGVKDKILVTYKSKWYNVIDVPAIILAANRSNGWPFMVRLEDDKGKVINLGHDDDGGAPGSGPFMHLDFKNMKLVEKYVPKRLDGKVKLAWKVGDRFIPKEGFCLDQQETDEITGVQKSMVEAVGEEMTIATIIPMLGVDWLVDATHSHMWLKDWIDPVE